MAEAVLANGENLPADVVVVGIGERPQQGEGRQLWEWGQHPASPGHLSSSPGHRSLQSLSHSVIIQPFLLAPSTWKSQQPMSTHLAGGKELVTLSLCLWLLLSSTGPCCIPRACCVLGPGFIAPVLAQHQPKHSSLLQVLCSKQEQALWGQISSSSLLLSPQGRSPAPHF